MDLSQPSHTPGEIVVRVLVEPVAHGLPLPETMTSGAAAVDLRAALDAPIVLEPGAFALISTGIRLEIPDGYEGQVRPRSGLAARHGVTLLNSPGTIDSDYRGIVQVIVINHGRQPFTVQHGDRIAQLLISPVVRPRFVVSDSLSQTERNDGGFGHTGTR
jgi:dUTP pyrophosphatase